ncbi:MAG: CBO0543 family protein [Acidobacteriota bacterium]
MNLGWNIETYISVSALIVSVVVTIMIVRLDWKKYGLLYLLSSVIGVILCYIFLELRLYSFPYRLFPQIAKIPFTAILTTFPLYVLVGVRYSPRLWPWKIPFYWGLVHLGVFAEAWLETHTQLIKYMALWDLWDSYTAWWLFLLIFEWVGGLIVPAELRKPIDQEVFSYGKLGYLILHFILISTIFLAGVHMGKVMMK